MLEVIRQLRRLLLFSWQQELKWVELLRACEQAINLLTYNT